MKIFRKTESLPSESGRVAPIRRSLFARAERADGMTVIELLVAVSIVAVLGVIGSGVYSNATKKTALMREIQAARTLITAYNAYAGEHSGRYLYAVDNAAEPVDFPGRTSQITGLDLYKYPFRLASYFSYQLDGVILVNRNKSQIAGVSGFPTDIYGTAMYPALGINSMIGGTRTVSGNGTVTVSLPNEILSTQAEGERSLLVFTSASDGTIDGFHTVTAPFTTARANNWGARVLAANAGSKASDFGNVSVRHDGKAVCAFLDGSVRTLTLEELSDMRLWSKNARAQDNPTYTYTSGSGGGR